MKKKSFLGVVLIFALLFTACAKKDVSNKDESGKKVIYASVYPVYDFAKKIAGDKFDIRLVVPVGQEPHGYEIGTDELKGISDADMFIYNGAGLEGFAEKIIEAVDNDKLKIVEASDGLELLKSTHSHDHDHESDDHEAEDHNHNNNHDNEAEDHNHNNNHDNEAEDHNHNNNHNHEAEDHDHDHDHDHGLYDPHTWLSPKNAMKELENIKDAICDIDPENKDFYEANFKKYKKDFEDLDKEYSEKLEPYKGRKIVVSHEAFGYISRDYGIEQMGIRGINAETEPDAKTMAMITDYVREKNVKVIFTEELLDTKVSEAIASETGAKILPLNPVEGLSQEEIDSGEDYVSVMRKNLENMLEAFN